MIPATTAPIIEIVPATPAAIAPAFVNAFTVSVLLLLYWADCILFKPLDQRNQENQKYNSCQAKYDT